MIECSTCMKRNVVSLPETATLAEAATRFVAEHIGTLPIVSGDGRLVGILHLRDLLRLVMPSFTVLLEDFDFVGDFGVFEDRTPPRDILTRPVTTVMEPAVAVQANSGLLRAFALMSEHDLYDLPIVDESNRLVGIASRVDMGTALLASWQRTSTQT